MDLSRPPPPPASGLFSPGGGLVLPRHPATPTSLSPPASTKVSQSSTNGGTNAKAAFFSISNLVNGLRQQQEQSNGNAGGVASPEISTSKGKTDSPTVCFCLQFKLVWLIDHHLPCNEPLTIQLFVIIFDQNEGKFVVVLDSIQ